MNEQPKVIEPEPIIGTCFWLGIGVILISVMSVISFIQFIARLFKPVKTERI